MDLRLSKVVEAVSREPGLPYGVSECLRSGSRGNPRPIRGGGMDHLTAAVQSTSLVITLEFGRRSHAYLAPAPNDTRYDAGGRSDHDDGH
jgi:hypothetical protein